MTDSGSHPSDDQERWSRLTDKQRACLDLLLERQTSKQIARRLGISKQAVDLRITTARHILDAANRDETAIIYARLRQTYDRMSCDPIILASKAELVSSRFPDGGPPDAMPSHDSASPTERPMGRTPSFRDYWRQDQARSRRVWIMATMLVALAFLILTGLAIAQALKRLISG
jgi:DNA-binding CsgD family transcriptional regulator